MSSGSSTIAPLFFGRVIDSALKKTLGKYLKSITVYTDCYIKFVSFIQVLHLLVNIIFHKEGKTIRKASCLVVTRSFTLFSDHHTTIYFSDERERER